MPEEPKIPIPHVDKFKITEEVPKTQSRKIKKMTNQYLKGKNHKSPSVDERERSRHNFRSNRSSKATLNKGASQESLEKSEINKLLRQYQDFEEFQKHGSTKQNQSSILDGETDTLFSIN